MASETPSKTGTPPQKRKRFRMDPLMWALAAAWTGMLVAVVVLLLVI